MRRTPPIILLLLAAAAAYCPRPAVADIESFPYEGNRYVKLEDLAALYGGQMIPSPSADRIRIKLRQADLEFKPDSRELRISNTLVWLHEPMHRIGNSWTIREVDAKNTVDAIMRPGVHLKKAGHRLVVLDPGHGGEDTGAKGKRRVEEKRAALDICRRIKSQLMAAGIKVYMTRDSDRFIELEQRTALAKRWGADLFVSVHLNSAASTTAEGVETFVLSVQGHASTSGGSGADSAVTGNKFDIRNSALGFQLHRSLTKETGAVDRGLKRARFIVLRNASCPAALVECGFLSNAVEEGKFMREEYRDKAARGIAKGIIHYITLARKSRQPESP